jgi:hypothetical protein
MAISPQPRGQSHVAAAATRNSTRAVKHRFLVLHLPERTMLKGRGRGGRVLTEVLPVAVPTARDKDCIVYYNTEQELHKRK